MSKKLLRSLNRIEDRIRPSHFEHLIFLDENGRQLFKDKGTHSKSGNRPIPIEIIGKSYVCIHNHPLALNPFSPNDFGKVFYWAIPVNRVVTLDGTYEIVLGEELLSDSSELTRILDYYYDLIAKQSQSEEYKSLHEMLSEKSKIGRLRKEIHDKCRENGDYTRSYEFDKANGFLELNKKSLLEAMDQTSKFFGFVCTFYPVTAKP